MMLAYGLSPVLRNDTIPNHQTPKLPNPLSQDLLEVTSALPNDVGLSPIAFNLSPIPPYRLKNKIQ